MSETQSGLSVTDEPLRRSGDAFRSLQKPEQTRGKENGQRDGCCTVTVVSCASFRHVEKGVWLTLIPLIQVFIHSLLMPTAPKGMAFRLGRS